LARQKKRQTKQKTAQNKKNTKKWPNTKNYKIKKKRLTKQTTKKINSK
jgi:hypothetical protein